MKNITDLCPFFCKNFNVLRTLIIKLVHATSETLFMILKQLIYTKCSITASTLEIRISDLYFSTYKIIRVLNY